MFRGAFTALVTPFKDGEIDEAALRNHIEEQIAGGIDGLVPCGSTGESATLTHVEHDNWCDYLKGKGECNCSPDISYKEVKNGDELQEAIRSTSQNK